MSLIVELKPDARDPAARARSQSRWRSIVPFVYSRRRGERSVATPDNAGLPSILVVSILKSGTVFTNLMLARGLSLEQMPVSFGYFPHYLIDIPKVVSFIKGGKVARAHFDPSPVNFQSLTPFIRKWVLHIRDPRSVVLSWVHHMNRVYSERENGEYQHLFVYPTPPEAYYDWPFHIQVDWNIDNFLPSVVTWTRSWLAVYDSRQYDILLTTYSELCRDECAYIQKITDFYGIPRERFNRPKIEKTIPGSHFRAGLEDEWITEFTSDQILRSTATIGQDLLTRFAWRLACTRLASHHAPTKAMPSRLKSCAARYEMARPSQSAQWDRHRTLLYAAALADLFNLLAGNPTRQGLASSG